MRVTLPDYPWLESPAMAADQELLDGLAGRLASGSMTEFLFGAVPLVVLGDLLTADPDGLPLPGYIWLMHLSGYFGGVWLRGQIAQALPDAPLLGVAIAPDEEALRSLVSDVDDSLTAWRAGDAAVLSYSEAHLDGHVDGYGYNRGYLLQILDEPPVGLRSPPGFLQVDGPLACRYQVGELPGLDGLRARFTRGATDWTALVRRIVATETEADARGRNVWSTGLSVQGFPQPEYEQLLRLSAFFLMGTQAVALSDAIALATSDAAVARRGALLAAGLVPWSRSYMMGLLEGRDGQALPTFG